MKKYIIMHDCGGESIPHTVHAKTHEEAVKKSGIDIRRIDKIYRITEEWIPKATWTSKTY